MRGRCIAVGLAGVLLAPTGCGDERPRLVDLADRVLALPAAQPDWRTHPAVQAHQDIDPPRPDADFADICWYWLDNWDECPPPEIRARFLSECQHDPALIPLLRRLLPRSEEATQLVKGYRDRGALERLRLATYGEPEEDWYLSPRELLARARKDGDADLVEPLLPDPDALEVLRELDPDARVLGLLSKHGTPRDQKRAREGLKALALSARAKDRERVVALEELARRKWDGREKWFAAALAREDVCALSGDWFTEFVLEAPAQRLPLLLAMCDNKRAVIRNSAAPGLLALGTPEALRPLLPRLKHAAWDRLPLLRALVVVDLPESHELLRDLMTAGDREERDKEDKTYRKEQVLAAIVLARTGDEHAIRLLKERFDAGEIGWEDKPACIEALALGGGIDLEDALAGIERVARQVADWRAGIENEMQGTEVAEEWWPVDGRHAFHACLLRGPGAMADELAGPLLARASELAKTDQRLATEIRVRVHAWPCRTSARDLMAGIVKGTAPARSVRWAVRHRKDLVSRVEPELRAAFDRGGVAGGLAAAILEEEVDPDDPDALRALLAAGRVAPLELEVAQVERFLDDGAAANKKRRRLAAAAALYLDGLDTHAARVALRAHGLSVKEPAPELRREFAGSRDLLEIYRWTDGTQSGGTATTVRRFEDRVELAWADADGRDWRRRLSAQEWASLTAFFRRNRIDDLPDLPHQAEDGIWHTYQHLTRDDTASVSINNPGVSSPDDAVYTKLALRFLLLRSRGGLRLHYSFDAEVLVGEKGLGVDCLVVRGEDLFVRLGIHRMDIDYAWFRLDADGLGKETKKPGEAPEPYDVVKPHFWKMELADGLLFTNREGLRLERGEQTTNIASGHVGYPTVTRDWLFVAWNGRLSWLDRSEFRIRRVSEDGLALLRWLPARHAALVWRKSTEEHFLLDPATGQIERVDGDFDPFHGFAATAPRKGAGFFVARNTEDGVQICLYDTHTFQCLVLRTLPLSHLDDIHVDEEANLLYVVHEGLLLRTRLRE